MEEAVEVTAAGWAEATVQRMVAAAKAGVVEIEVRVAAAEMSMADLVMAREGAATAEGKVAAEAQAATALT